jgi:hypothetical protein
MLRTPQNNGDRVIIPNRFDYRLALEAYNFHAESVGPQRIVMRRLGPDRIIFAGAKKVRREMTRSFITSLERDMRPA